PAGGRELYGWRAEVPPTPAAPGHPCPYHGRGLTCTFLVLSSSDPPSGAVRTHTPPSVSATVCSQCAARPPSSVTTVQSSASTRVRPLPRASMGSTARHIPGRSRGPRREVR